MQDGELIAEGVCRRLAGTIRPQQAEHLSSLHAHSVASGVVARDHGIVHGPRADKCVGVGIRLSPRSAVKS
jgi:hypothetical protein